MPGRCALNGLQTEKVFSSQLIQLAKAFQTVVHLGRYNNKIPLYNSLKACNGNRFVFTTAS